MEYDPLHPDNWSDEEEYFDAIAEEYPVDYESAYMIEQRNLEQARLNYTLALTTHMRIWRMNNPDLIGLENEIRSFEHSYHVSDFNTGQ